MQKSKWLSGEALQIAVKRREAKNKGERERYTHLNAEFERIARRDKKVKVKSLSRVQHFATPWIVAHGIFQARVPEWVAISFSRGIPDPGITPGSSTLQAEALPLSHQGSPLLFRKSTF